MAYYWRMWQLTDISQLRRFMKDEDHYIGICFSLVDRKEFESIKQISSLLISLNTPKPTKIILLGLRTAVRDHVLISQNSDKDIMNINCGNWINVPDELVLYIFHFLEKDEKDNIERTCKRFFLLSFNYDFPGINCDEMDIITPQDIEDLKRDLNVLYISANPKIIYRELKKNSSAYSMINIGKYPKDT